MASQDWQHFDISQRAVDLPASATLALAATAGRMRAEGRDVVDLSVGEPDFPTPSHIVEAAFGAVEQGMTHYTPTAGIPELREAVAEEFRRVHGRECGLGNVVVTPGAKFALYAAFQVLLDPGDKVIVPAPYWVSYPRMVELACGEPVVVQTRKEDRFRLRPEDLEAHLDDRVKVVVMNSPANPTGVAYTLEDLQAIEEVLERHPQVRVVWDEIYRKLVYHDFQYVGPSRVEGLASRCVFVDGVSKAYAMTGWRLGYAVGDEEVISSMVRFQSHTTSNAPAVSQAAALAALKGPQEPVEEMRRRFEARRDFLLENLREVPGLDWVEPDGAFYVFLDVRAWLDRLGCEDHELAGRILEEAAVACVPGSAFGTPGYFRLSFAASLQSLEQAVARLRDWARGQGLG